MQQDQESRTASLVRIKFGNHKNDWNLLKIRKIFQDPDSPSSLRDKGAIGVPDFERETSKRIYVVRREADKHSNDCQTRLCMARKYGRKLEKAAQNREKERMGKRKAKTWTMLEKTERNLLFRSKTTKIIQKLSKNARRKLERPVRMDKQQPSIVKTNAEPKNWQWKRVQNSVWLYSGSHESTR